MSNSARRMSTRTRRVAPKMVAALASNDNRTQVRSSHICNICDSVCLYVCILFGGNLFSNRFLGI